MTVDQKCKAEWQCITDLQWVSFSFCGHLTRHDYQVHDLSLTHCALLLRSLSCALTSVSASCTSVRQSARSIDMEASDVRTLPASHSPAHPSHAFLCRDRSGKAARA